MRDPFKFSHSSTSGDKAPSSLP